MTVWFAQLHSTWSTLFFPWTELVFFFFLNKGSEPKLALCSCSLKLFFLMSFFSSWILTVPLHKQTLSFATGLEDYNSLSEPETPHPMWLIQFAVNPDVGHNVCNLNPDVAHHVLCNSKSSVKRKRLTFNCLDIKGSLGPTYHRRFLRPTLKQSQPTCRRSLPEEPMESLCIMTCVNIRHLSLYVCVSRALSNVVT